MPDIPLSINGRLESLGLSSDLIATSAVELRDPGTNVLVASVALADDGTFGASDLPEQWRGKTFDLVVTRLSDGEVADVSRLPVTIPEIGSLSVTADAGLDRSRQLIGKKGLLTGELMAKTAREGVERQKEFRNARKQIYETLGSDLIEPDWSINYLDGMHQSDNFISSSHLGKVDIAKESLRNPAAGMKHWIKSKTKKRARLRLTEEEKDSLGGSPTLCTAVAAHGRERGFERRPRLGEQLTLTIQLDALQIPKSSAPDVAEPDPGAAPAASISALEKEADRGVLRRVAEVIADLSRNVAEPSTATDLKRLHDIAAELELSTGPANVTAARDVNVLQVAFGTLETASYYSPVISGTQQYAQMRSQSADWGVDLPELPSAADPKSGLEEIFGRAQELLAAAISAEAAPTIVTDTWTDVTPSTWGRLSDDARDRLIAAALSSASVPRSSDRFGDRQLGAGVFRRRQWDDRELRDGEQ